MKAESQERQKEEEKPWPRSRDGEQPSTTEMSVYGDYDGDISGRKR
jgi:hypothetical protein